MLGLPVRTKEVRYRCICFATRISEEERELLPGIVSPSVGASALDSSEEEEAEAVACAEVDMEVVSEEEEAELEESEYHQYVWSEPLKFHISKRSFE